MHFDPDSETSARRSFDGWFNSQGLDGNEWLNERPNAYSAFLAGRMTLETLARALCERLRTDSERRRVKGVGKWEWADELAALEREIGEKP